MGAYPSLPSALVRLLTKVNPHEERDPSCDLEACKLVWLLAFDPISKASLLAAGVGEALDHVYASSSPDVGPFAAGEASPLIALHACTLRPRCGFLHS